MTVISFTDLFNRGRNGDSAAFGLAYEIVYAQLCRVAALALSREHRCHSIQPAGLVSDAFLKLLGLDIRVSSREHFLGLASRAMREVLIDRGRAKEVRQRLDPKIWAALPTLCHPRSEAEMTLHEVWRQLRDLDPRAAETVWLLKVEGMTLKQVAHRQRRRQWKVKADGDFAIDWMARKIEPRAQDC